MFPRPAAGDALPNLGCGHQVEVVREAQQSDRRLKSLIGAILPSPGGDEQVEFAHHVLKDAFAAVTAAMEKGVLRLVK